MCNILFFNQKKVYFMATRVQIINEANTGNAKVTGHWELCFQWCQYVHDDGENEMGYRFIWRRPNGALQAARGQARIPSMANAMELMTVAMKEGWGNNQG